MVGIQVIAFQGEFYSKEWIRRRLNLSCEQRLGYANSADSIGDIFRLFEG